MPQTVRHRAAHPPSPRARGRPERGLDILTLLADPRGAFGWHRDCEGRTVITFAAATREQRLPAQPGETLTRQAVTASVLAGLRAGIRPVGRLFSG